MKLIPNWRKAHRMASMQLAAIGSLLTSVLIAVPDVAVYAWNMLPAEFRSWVPPQYMPLVGVVIFALSMLARVVQQKSVSGDGK